MSQTNHIPGSLLARYYAVKEQFAMKNQSQSLIVVERHNTHALPITTPFMTAEDRYEAAIELKESERILLPESVLADQAHERAMNEAIAKVNAAFLGEYACQPEDDLPNLSDYVNFVDLDVAKCADTVNANYQNYEVIGRALYWLKEGSYEVSTENLTLTVRGIKGAQIEQTVLAYIINTEKKGVAWQYRVYYAHMGGYHTAESQYREVWGWITESKPANAKFWAKSESSGHYQRKAVNSGTSTWDTITIWVPLALWLSGQIITVRGGNRMKAASTILDYAVNPYPTRQ